MADTKHDHTSSFRATGKSLTHTFRKGLSRAESRFVAKALAAPSFDYLGYLGARGYKGLQQSSAPVIQHPHTTDFVSFARDRFFWTNSVRRSFGRSQLSTMPKGRRFKKRKRGGSHTAYHLASQAMTKIRKLERKVEVKFFDHVVTTQATVANTGVIINLVLMAQGNTRATRDGNLITPFHLNMRLQWIGLAATTTELMRTIIFRDKRQVAATVPLVLDVLTANNVLSTYAANTRKRWKILFDHTWTSHNDAAIRLNFFANLRLNLKLKMGFRGPATTDINLNGLFMINIANGTPNFVFSARIFFNDL